MGTHPVRETELASAPSTLSGHPESAESGISSVPWLLSLFGYTTQSCAISASLLGHPCPPYWRQQVVSCLNEAPFWACLQTGRPGNSPVLLTTSEKAKCFVQIAKEQGSFSWPFLLLRRTLAGGDKQNTSRCQGL